MQDMTQVCEAMVLKVLEVEARLDQMEASLEGVAVAMESDGLHELLDAVGGRLGDLKGLLGVEGEPLGAPEVVASSGEELDLHASLNDATGEVAEPAEEMDTIYVDDPQMDLMSA